MKKPSATPDLELVWNTQDNAVRSRDWAAGSRTPAERVELLADYPEAVEGEESEAEMWFGNIVYSAALFKCIDEPLVNAIDQYTILSGADYSRPPTPRVSVKKISIDFDKSTEFGPWRVSVWNDGRGIPLDLHGPATTALGRSVHVPTVWFGHLYQGSNTRKDPRSVTGGANGMGTKISNIFSHRFRLSTRTGGVLFEQEWSEGMRVEHPPRITSQFGEDYTQIEFYPDLSQFGDSGGATVQDSDWGNMNRLIYTRVLMAATYVAHLPGPKPRIYYRGNLMNCLPTEPARLVSTHFGRVEADDSGDIDPPPFLDFVIEPVSTQKDYVYPLHCTVLSRGGITAGNVNGIVIREQSPLLALLRMRIAEGVAARVQPAKKDNLPPITTRQVNNCFSLFINARISSASWDGQGKNILNNDKRLLGAAYPIDDAQLDTIAALLRDVIYYDVSLAMGREKKKPKCQIDRRKYRPALNAKSGGQGRKTCHLIITEGDSAKSNVIDAITMNRNMRFKKYGIMTTGGVIINVRKHAHWETMFGRRFIVEHPKLAANQFFTSLMYVTNLKYGNRYDPASPTFEAEMNSLKYGSIDLAVDQDLDGLGAILALFLNAFAVLWPNLYRSGFIRWLPTPIVRAYPKSGGQVLSFYHMPGFNDWQRTAHHSQYDIHYYKGLGSHSTREMVASFADYEQRVLTFTLDPASLPLFETYHGDSADARKEILQRPTIMTSESRVVEQYKSGQILCSELLLQDVCLYQKDNLSRKLDNYVDGLNQVARKILHGAMRITSRNRPMKVTDLAGQILSSQNYDHGIDSLVEAVIARGFISPGGRQLPMFLPHGNWGSRFEGGRDHASARYIKAEYNWRINELIYPEADYELLHFERREGVVAEPQSFVPIIPTSIVESLSLPAHGWAITVWGRDIDSVINAVYTLTVRPHSPVPRLRPATHQWRGRIIHWAGETYSCGAWHYEGGNRIVITELPLRIWTNTYIEKNIIDRDRIVAEYEDQSTRDSVHIIVTLTDEAIARLGVMAANLPVDQISVDLKLVKRMKSQLNYTTPECDVRTFENYEQVLASWFPIRRDLYSARIDRQLILLGIFHKHYYPNLLRYIADTAIGGELCGKSVAEMHKILASAGYQAINIARLNQPGIVPNGELETLILPTDPDAGWSYLLDVTDRKRSAESVAKLRRNWQLVQDQISDMENDAARGAFRGATIWQRELVQLRRVIHEGMAGNWDWGRSSKYQL